MSKLIKVALANIRNIISEKLYINFGIDKTKPLQVYCLITEKCTARCQMCEFWRKSDYSDELPAEIWIKALREFHQISPGVHVQFTGGEPFLKQDFFEIIEECGKLGISYGIVTNGELINEKNVERLIDANVNNINISLDSPYAEVHDRLRGKEGLFDRVVKAIYLISTTAAKKGKRITISIKPTVHNDNFRDLPLLLKKIKEWGAAVLNIQPLTHKTDECNNLKIKDEEAYIKVVDELMQMQKDGYPLANSRSQFISWIPILKGENIDRKGICKVGLRLISIVANGDTYYCSPLKSIIGNIKNDSAKTLWFGEKAKILRKKTIKCKLPCTASCYSERTLMEKIHFFLLMFGKKS